MAQSNSPIDRFKQAWQRFLWEQDSGQPSSLKGFCLRQLQTLTLVLQDFIRDRCMLRASALTYASLLAIVPLLALTFALLKAFGVQNALEPLILEKLNVGSQEVVASILSYVNNTQVAKLGVFGLLFLLIAVISLLSNIEESFNHVWGVKGLRPLLRRFSDYLSVLLVGPVLLLSAISMTSSLTSHLLVQRLIDLEVVGEMILALFKLGPYLLMWVAFALMYVFMSNTRVEWRAALVGGIIGGTLWQLAQWSYVNFQVGVAKYNAIYGTMAALPIFMIWVYISWNIVLFGLEFTYARQNLRTGGPDLHAYEVSRSSQERVQLQLLLTVANRFYHAAPPLSREALALKLGVPPRLCAHFLQELVSLGLIAESGGDQKREVLYQLGRAAETLCLSDVLVALRNQGVQMTHLKPTVEASAIDDFWGEKGQAGMSRRTLKDLVDQTQPVEGSSTPADG